MAILRDVCLQCKAADAAYPDSHYCSDECKAKWMETHGGPIQCYCDAELDTIGEAKAAGWMGIEPYPEGATCNWRGLCPNCKKEKSCLQS